MSFSSVDLDPACRPGRSVPARAARRLVAALRLTIAAFAVSGCSIILDPDPCPEVLCAEGCSIAEGEDGCQTCECTEPPIEVCFNSDECGEGQRCDTDNFCEGPPGCTDGEPCPAVCYGRCVDEPTGCTSDGDCADGERCRVGQAITGDGAVSSDDLREPEPGDGDGDPGQQPPGEEPVPAPPPDEGVCVPEDCPESLALPACPPGTELVIDFENDACGDARCVRTDDTCRGLSPEACEETAGCRTESVSVPCGCGADPAPPGDDNGAEEDRAAPCECPDIAEVICVEVDGCQGLGPDACAANPDCVGETYYGDCAGGADAFCDPDDEGCGAAPCQPTEEFICLPRHDDGCNSGGDCPPGTVCVTESNCTELCWEAEDGTSGCEVECWEGEGYCAPSTEDCWSLPPEQCEARDDCMIEYQGVPCDCDPNGADDCACPDIAEAVCVPRPTQNCFSDLDCGDGQYCDLETYCPDCEGDGDIDCAAPCFVEGVCRGGGPPPTGCTDDEQCGDGYHCESVTVCEDCAPEPGNNDPCTGACWNEGICVWDGGLDGYCYSDNDCSADAFCNFDNCLSDPTCPECDVCAFRCEPREPVDVCWSNEDCGGDRICDSVNYCEADPACQDGEPCDAVCYGRCVEPVPPDDLCLDDGDCGMGERCATEQDICLCPDGSPNCFGAICYSQCVPVEGDQICYSDAECGNGQFCMYEDPACADGSDPDNGSGLIACEGLCAPVEMPPPTECFSDDDCAMMGEGYACVEDEGCDPNVDFCPATCQMVGDCIQIITPARNPETGSCVEFSTPCDVPDGWELVMSCDADGGGNTP